MIGMSGSGTWGGSEQDSFLAMVKPFEDATGTKVEYEGTRDLNAVLTEAARLASGPWHVLIAGEFKKGKSALVNALLGVPVCSADPVTSFEDAQRCDLEAHAAWCRELLSRGVYPPPSQFEAWFPSLAHGAEQIERTLEAAAAAFACLPAPGGQP